MMLLIYSTQTSPRLEYVCEVIFRHILNIEFVITTDLQFYNDCKDLKIKYEAVSPLLFEHGLKTQDEQNLFNDRLALAFYILSCYEEYLPECKKDEHGRLISEHSFLVRFDFDQKPIIHIIANYFKEHLSKQYPNFVWPEKTYHFIPTFDIDIAYASKGKTWIRFIGALLRAFFNKDSHKCKELIAARFNPKFKDPYDVFDLHQKLFEKYPLKPIYFFLTSKYTFYDKNLYPKSVEFKKLVLKLKKFANIGIHPSYYSNRQKIKSEKKLLEKIASHKITQSRQHFLRISFPETYQNLIYAGITDDYSLGYTDRIGFRAGICVPYPFYDVSKEKKTPLIIHPLIFMDGALMKQNLSDEDFLREIDQITEHVKNVKGEMIALWHNSSMPENSTNYTLFMNSFIRML